MSGGQVGDLKRERIERAIRERILDGTYPVGKAIPGKPALVREFEVAGGTVESAIRRLKAEGILEAREMKTWVIAAPASVDGPSPRTVNDRLADVERRLDALEQRLQ